MKAPPKISDAEWEVMRIIWARHPITAFEIIEGLTTASAGWHPKTVRTLLARLVKKGVLEYTPRGNLYYYEPKASEQDCVANASASFLDRVFGGSLRPMLAHFVERQDLSKSDLEELRRLLDRAEKAQGRDRSK